MLVVSHFFKAVTLKAAGLITMPMGVFFATDFLTGNVGLGTLLAAICSCATAIFVTRPKVIAAKAAALVAQTASTDNHVSELVRRLNEIHKTEIDFWKDRVFRYEKSEILIRATKHKLINAYTAACAQITLLEEILRERGIPIESGRYNPEPFSEITGEEDQKMIRSLFPEHLHD